MGRLLAALATTAAVLLLAGCSSPSRDLPPDTAAVVGEKVVTVGELDALVAELQGQLGLEPTPQAQTASEHEVLRHLIGLEIVRTAAAQEGIAVSPQKSAEEWVAEALSRDWVDSADVTAAGPAMGVPRSVAIDQMELLLLLEALGAGSADPVVADQVFTRLSEVSHELGAAVNTRYGIWDHDQLRVVPSN